MNKIRRTRIAPVALIDLDTGELVTFKGQENWCRVYLGDEDEYLFHRKDEVVFSEKIVEETYFAFKDEIHSGDDWSKAKSILNDWNIENIGCDKLAEPMTIGVLTALVELAMIKGVNDQHEAQAKLARLNGTFKSYEQRNKLKSENQKEAREMQSKLLSEGKHPSSIAGIISKRMNLSPRTIRTYLSSKK